MAPAYDHAEITGIAAAHAAYELVSAMAPGRQSRPMAEPVTGGAAVVDALVAHGVRDVFGIPGTHNLEIYRYLPGLRDPARRHPARAGSRVRRRRVRPRDRPARGARHDLRVRASPTRSPRSPRRTPTRCPLLAVSPGPPRGQERADVGWLHEVKDQQAALDAVTARSIRVESADEVPEVVADVFEGFAATRPRPVHLEVPVDVLEGEWVRRAGAGGRQPEPAGARHPRRRSAIAGLLAAAASPLLVAGGGARGAVDEIRALAEPRRPGAHHRQRQGRARRDASRRRWARASGSPAAHRAMNDADLLLVVGSELGDSDLWGGMVQPGTPGERTVVRVDIDPAQLHKNVTRRPRRPRRRRGRPRRRRRRPCGPSDLAARTVDPATRNGDRRRRGGRRRPVGGDPGRRCATRCPPTPWSRATARR